YKPGSRSGASHRSRGSAAAERRAGSAACRTVSAALIPARPQIGRRLAADVEESDQGKSGAEKPGDVRRGNHDEDGGQQPAADRDDPAPQPTIDPPHS